MRRFFFSLWFGISVVAGIFGGLVTPAPVSAQVQTGLQQVGSTINLPSTDPRVIATNIINVSLGLIGIILVTLMLYAGFLWMTSGGAADKTAAAKKIITNSIIGLVIVLSAWAITRFVIDRLLSATQGDSGVVSSSGGGGGLGGGFAGGGGADPFRAKSIQPAGKVSIRNVEVKIVFNKAADLASAASITVMKSGGSAVPGTVEINGSVATFAPSAACPAPNADRKCFDPDTDYIVKIAGTLKSVSGQTISCSGFGAVCDGAFHSGTVVDTQPPVVSYSFPTDGMSISANALTHLVANASDDAGVTTIEFFDGSNSLFVDAPTASSTPLSFLAHADWMTTGASLGSHTLAVLAHDVDTNISARATVNVIVRAEHCFNGKMDAPGETGIDCGGDSSSPEYCGACAGGSCKVNADCSSGFCSAGKCVVQPVISSASPLDGKAGTFVTLKGTNFGYTNGTVTFLGAPGAGDDVVATVPAACSAAGVNTWSNSEVTVEVPVGAASGPIEIKNSSSGLADQTSDSNGPKIPDFVVNGNSYPGLCGLVPSEGTVSSYVDAIGQGFGTAGTVTFQIAGKTTPVSSVDSWSDGRIHMRVPVVDIGTQNVTVQSSSKLSNGVDFTVLDKTASAVPTLAAIDPVEGPPLQYVTLTGANFGASIGKVVFTSTAGGGDAIGDTSFPSTCADGFWRDDRIVVKVPTVYTGKGKIDDGKFTVKVVRADGSTTGPVDFTVNSTLKVTPGICSIVPSVGPLGTVVKIFGDQFGTETPLVTFYLNKAADVKSNTSQEVDTSVPNSPPNVALTGPVQLRVGGVLSNKVNFQVRNCNESPDICATGEQCCPTGECQKAGGSCGVKALATEYAWQTSTGIIPVAPRVIEECAGATSSSPALAPSPSPWLNRAGGDAVAINNMVTMRFSRQIASESLRSGNFLFYKCIAGGGNDCAKQEAVPYLLTSTDEANGQTLVKMQPTAVLTTSTLYEVRVVQKVHASGVGAAPMDVMKSCPTGPGGETYGYCFRFKTRGTSDFDKIGSVLVAPSLFTMKSQDEKETYTALPVDAADSCIVLNCSLYSWDWYTGTPASKGSDGRAVLGSTGGPGVCDNIVTGKSETSSVPVNINAEVSGTGPSGYGKLFVNFVPPHVTTYFPNCQFACSNDLLWAEFSNELDPVTATNNKNIEIRQCKNANCNIDELSPALVLRKDALTLVPNADGEAGRRLEISQKTDTGVYQLVSGAYYRVLLISDPTVSGSIVGKNGLPLDGRNDPRGFQWVFRVKTDVDATCAVDRVDVLPKEKYETKVGARQQFSATAFGKPDECSADGQTIDPISPVSWTSGDTNVADFQLVNGKLVDTGAKLPAGCSASCLATGASVVYGKAAACGNGVIETTDSTWCAKLNLTGMGISGAKCQTLPVGSSAGEECEPSIFGADKCDPNTCLFLPVKKVTDGGSCGDGVVDIAKGEACDYGLRCTGMSATSTLANGSPCMTTPDKTACAAAGGTCGVIAFRGCTDQCRHLGSASVKGSVCGNSSIDDGEDCDYGNTTGGNGCSAQCLHEGSLPSKVISSQCGNGILEPGEVCERPILAGGALGPFPVGCDQKTCLHTGTITCLNAKDPNCCGNHVIDSGEDCDGGDGCSTSCLFMGSSINYNDATGKIDPSFCGNGVLERGEQCEAGAPSNGVAAKIGYVGSTPTPLATPSIAIALDAFKTPINSTPVGDASQLAYVVGKAIPDASGVMKTDISINLEGKVGKAVYGLQCGLQSESSCELGYGLDKYGCCRERPEVVKKTPAPGQPDVCRNVQIQADFNVVMDQPSTTANFQVSEAAPTIASNCPPGTMQALVEATYGPGLKEWLRKTWDHFIALFTGHPAYAQKWCVGNVTGQLMPVDGTTSTKRFAYQLDHALASNTLYRIRFIGDTAVANNATAAQSAGLTSVFGVHQENDLNDTGKLSWTFSTGAKICNVNVVSILDVTPDLATGNPHPYLYLNAGHQPETREFAAEARYMQGGVAVALSTTAEYSWNWGAWSSNATKIVEDPVTLTVPTFASATSKNENGNAILSVGIQVASDTVSIPPTTNSVIRGVAPVSVLACQNPWPSDSAPFRDAVDSKNFHAGEPFAGGPFYNFSTMYCRDPRTGDATSSDMLLPELTINQVTSTAIDNVQGILRQYLFSYPTDDRIPGLYKGLGLQQDGIGIRILSNPQHLSPEEWYASRGFKGTPTATTVDGYPAVQDGTTIYVAAVNRPVGGGSIYSNIYLISYNQGALPVTEQIYKQMVQYLAFNVNTEFTDQSNVCVTPDGFTFVEAKVNGGKPISCTADYECLAYAGYNSSLHCDSTKWKLIRDTIRLQDFQKMTTTLDTKRDSQGKYPQLLSGTFLQNQTNSIWSSWGKELGGLPSDPINRFLTCGQCSLTHAPCQSDASCSDAPGQTCQGGSYKMDPVTKQYAWTASDKIDPASCWNQDAHSYICPNIPDAGAYGKSRLYTYQSFNGGLRYVLGSEFEVPPNPGPASASLGHWWSPPLAQAVYRCNKDVAGAGGKNCTKPDGSGGDDRLCRPCPNGICDKCQSGVSVGEFCSSSSDCGGAVCSGDAAIPVVTGSCQQTGGTLQFRDVCNNDVVGDSGLCGDGILNAIRGETCEAGYTQSVACHLPDGTPGHRQQICDMASCTKYIDDPAHSACVADAVCGNGRIDKRCEKTSPSPGAACSTDAECGGATGSCAYEKCDDGSQNGKYGRCNVTCDGFGGYCGDNMIEPGEICDLGAANGTYGSLCGSDCHGVGPFCGDATVNGSEECDGGTDTSKNAVCSAGLTGKICTQDSDCTSGTTAGKCGGTPASNACGINAATGRAQQRTRTCSMPGNPDQCTWNSWSACQDVGSCGDGVLDSGEQCDNGTANGPTAACTNQCKKNICGDGNPETSDGKEECDNGADNGKTTCSAAYSSSCLSCTTSCKWTASAGGYCGDGTKNGPEQCDGKDGLTGVSCQSLGYDFGMNAPAAGKAGRCVVSDSDMNSDNSPTAVKEQQDFINLVTAPDYQCADDIDCMGGHGSMWYVEGRCLGDAPTCASSCSYGSCARCSDGPSDPNFARSISGKVLDPIYTQPIPGARVTLLFKGVKIAEVYTDKDGNYAFNKLVGVNVCSSYKVIVDYYGDNPNTPPDESVSGGYQSYTSPAFTAFSFTSVVGSGNGMIYLLPRVPAGEVAIEVNWNQAGQSATKLNPVAHLVLPYVYHSENIVENPTAVWSDPETYKYDAKCTTNCQKDITWTDPGLKDLTKFPYARLFCKSATGGGNCIADTSAYSWSPTNMSTPVIARYSRKLITKGTYEFYLEDYVNQWAPTGGNYVDALNLSVTVLTSDDARTIVAPMQPTCVPYKGLWDVFSQDASTGSLTEKNAYVSKSEGSARGLSWMGDNEGKTMSAGCPIPTITKLSPSMVANNTSAMPLTVTGSNFTKTSVVNWDGSPRTTTYISPTQVRIDLSDADLVGKFCATQDVTVTVSDSATSQTSAPATFSIDGFLSASKCASPTSPIVSGSKGPTVTSYSPTSVLEGVTKGGLTLTVNGTGFAKDAVVQWNGTTGLTTSYISATQLTALIPDSLVAIAGSPYFVVINPTPTWSSSAQQPFTITSKLLFPIHLILAPAPTLNLAAFKTFVPPSMSYSVDTSPGGTANVVKIGGSNFQSGGQVFVNGVSYPESGSTGSFIDANTVAVQFDPKGFVSATNKCLDTSVTISVQNPDGQSTGPATFPITKAAGCP